MASKGQQQTVVETGAGVESNVAGDATGADGGSVGVGSAGAGEKKEKVHKGNLKLMSGKDGDGEVLAVWQQARDSNVLGDLIIFKEARGKIATEVIVVTCLTAVSAERASGMNWFGGLGK